MIQENRFRRRGVEGPRSVRMRVVVCGLALFAACGGGAGSPSPVAPSPAPLAPAPEVAPAPAPPSGCAIERVTTASPLAQGRTSIVASLRNAGAETRMVRMQGVCPGGVARFTGLPAGADPYGTCAMGACAEPPAPIVLSLAPGQTVEIAQFVLDPAGGSCMPALAPKRYFIGFDVDLLGGESCPAGEAVVDVRSAAPEPAPRTRVRPAPAPTPPPARPEETLRRCPPMPACGIGCPGPMARDENGCTLCACEDMDLEPRILRAPPE